MSQVKSFKCPSEIIQMYKSKFSSQHFPNPHSYKGSCAFGTDILVKNKIVIFYIIRTDPFMYSFYSQENISWKYFFMFLFCVLIYIRAWIMLCFNNDTFVIKTFGLSFKIKCKFLLLVFLFFGFFLGFFRISKFYKVVSAPL
jgi:hypothetical protein